MNKNGIMDKSTKNKQLNQGLVKVEDLILEKDSANEWSIRQRCDTLAIYKTEKRALEVLDEIQNYILLPNTDNSAYIYEMPKE